jgi:D-3-phosphoglycerate dehydrogenase / 2-oxoglutarate reductase
MKKVLIPTKLHAVARETLSAHGGYEVVQDEDSSLADLAAAHADAYALFVRSEKVTGEVIDALPELKVIIRAGAGYNTIDVKYARSKGIDVMNTPGANANAVAEEVFALMLADARHVVKADPSVRSGKWEKKKFMGREITGKTMGIVGLGAIGRLVARHAQGFDMSLLGYDPVISDERARDLGIRLTDLETIFRDSDYVSLHLPENDDTRGLIDRRFLDLMKPGATLINCARAGVINEDDLRAVKAEKELRFLNDVYAKDAEGEKSVADIAEVMLPHLGASTKEANYNAARRAAEQLIEFDEKGISSSIVNRDVPEGLDRAFGDLAYTLARLCRHVVGPQTQLKLIETSFYGGLKDYADWLLVPIVAALSEDFDRSSDAKAARAYLQDMGVDYEDRETDDRKGYENSITVDLTGNVDADHLRSASVRGTVAEGTLMIARINDFDKLYFEPKGPTVIFVYRDRPGVLGEIAKGLGELDINIDDVRNPHDSTGERSIAILKVNQPVPGEGIEAIRRRIDADMGCCVTL